MFQTPIALFVFNRPDLTRKVFAEIARVKPTRLFVIADGPRNEAEAAKCAETRAVIERVDWDCDLQTDFSEINLNCKRRFTSGLNRVFAECEEAIVLEDDCLPHPTFFPFCAELLERYRTDERVMTISGDNFQFGTKRTEESYYFSRYTHTWGWASWRRAWQHFDPEVKLWPLLREKSRLIELFGEEIIAEHWRKVFDEEFAGTFDDIWDYQWSVACWAQSALTILPAVNLIANIGWREDATHTKSESNPMSGIETSEMKFPLRHPPLMIRDREADRYTFERLFMSREAQERTLYRRLRRKAAALLPAPVKATLARRKV